VRETAKHHDELVTLGAGGILHVRFMKGGGNSFVASG
jgi:hypothetical protein